MVLQPREERCFCTARRRWGIYAYQTLPFTSAHNSASLASPSAYACRSRSARKHNDGRLYATRLQFCLSRC